MLKRLKIGVAISCIFATCIFGETFGQSVLQDIKAKLNPGMTVVVNGKKLNVKGASGKKLSPIVYDGYTYVPVRPVADAAKVAYNFDSKTQTIYLGDMNVPPKRLIDISSKQDSGAFPIKSVLDKKILTISEGDGTTKNTYKFGLYADDITTYYNKEEFALNKKYNKLTFKTKCIKAGENYPIELIIKNKETDAALFDQKYNTGEGENNEVDVSGVKTLSVQIKSDFSDTSKGQKFLIVEPTLK